MLKRKLPLRKCSGCGESKPKKELIRIVKSPDAVDENGRLINPNGISLDLTGKKSGRGAYICRSAECLMLARKSRRIEHSFSCSIPDEVYSTLEKELAKNEQSQ